MSKNGLKNRDSAMHPSRTVDTNWQRRHGERGARMEKPTACPVFSDGKHRIMISPAGVRTRCLCGALR